MNLEQQSHQENPLETKLKEVKKLQQQLHSAKTNQEYNRIGDKIQALYTENNNELLVYEKETYGT